MNDFSNIFDLSNYDTLNGKQSSPKLDHRSIYVHIKFVYFHHSHTLNAFQTTNITQIYFE